MLLTVVMLLGLLPTAALAAEEDGICPHHPAHTEECGYAAPIEGQPCGHVHTEECYSDGVLPAGDEEKEADTCTHGEHDAYCGYVEASAESPCRYECGVCPVEALIQALPDPIQAGDAVAVEEAQTAYTALTEEECAQIDPVLTEKLFQAVDTLLLLAEEDPDAAQPSLQPTQQIQLQEDEIPLTAKGGELKSGTYVLTSDLTLTNNITISAEEGTKVTINLNGYTLTGNRNGSVITYLPKRESDAELIINGAGEGGTPGTITGGTGTKITSYGEDSYYGGGIYVDTDEYVPLLGEGDNSLTINDVVISKNEATNGGGAYIGVIVSAKLNGVTFSENTADWGGGLFGSIGHHGTGYDLSLRECAFTENTAHRGGGLYANGAFGCMNTSFRGNTATINEDDAGSGNGGAIYHYGATLNVAGCTIEENHAKRNGGGVYASGSGGQSSFGSSYVSGSSRPTVVRENTAAEYGGGLYLEQRVTFGGEISKNSAKAGGGIYLAGGHVKLSGTVTENKATDTGERALGGGGIAMSFTKEPHNFDDISTIKSVISGNTSAAGGGGISILIGGTDAQRGVSFDGATISGNTAAGDGGGVLLRVEESAPACEKNTTSYSDPGFSLSDTVVESNESTGGSGGGIAIDRQGAAAWGTEIDLSGVTIRENKAEKEGGGAAIRGVQISFDGESPVFGNLSETAGDDVFFTTPGTLTLPTPKAQNIQNLGRWYKDEANARYREGNITGTLESIENGSETYALTAGEIVVLTFDPAGGRLASGTETPVYAAKDSVISPPKDPTNGNRNRFLGWYTGSKSDSGGITYGEPVDLTQPVGKSMDLFAKWQAFYLVKFELGYGASFPEGVETAVQVDVGQEAAKPADPTRQGYQFKEWVDRDGNPWQFEAVVTGDMTLYASWERIAGEELPSVILHAETYGGSPAPEDQVLPKVELMDGTAVPQPLGVPMLDGFTFEYWYVDYFQLLRDSGRGQEADALEQQCTYYIEYIKGLLNNPELTEEDKAEFQEAIDSYQKILYGYSHAVLYGEGMGISEDDLEADGISVAFSYPEGFLEPLTYACHYVPDEDTTVTLHAQWSKDGELVETMTALTYKSNGGTTYAKEQYPSGAVVTLNKIPTRPGYDFTGWYADSSLSEEVASLTMDSDKTVYAGWTLKTTGTTVIIDATAGSGGSISPSGAVQVPAGGSQTFTITPGRGYHIADVKVNGASVGAVESYTFTNVQSNQTIAVTFSRNSSGGGGGGGGGHTKPSDPDEDIPDEPGPADPFDTGVGNWLNTKDHTAYLGGYGGGLFGPDDNMTRGQAAQMFYNLLLDKDVPITVSFTDVAPDAWYATAVNTLASLGIVTGYGNGQFGPDDSITRAQFTTIAMRFANLDTSGENIFTDVSEDDWFYEFVVGAIKYGWIGGYPDGRFGPNDTITRAQVTTIVNRMLGRSADEDYVERNIEELTRFTDVPDTHWAYYNIMEATNAHDYDRVKGQENWTRLHR